MEKLTYKDKQLFTTQGYLIVRQMASQAQVKLLCDEAEQQLAAAQAPVEYEADVAYSGAPDSRQEQGGDTIRRLLNAYQRHSSFAQWATHPSVVQAVTTLLDSDPAHLVQAHHNCIMTKHPSFSSSTMWHQDFRYWHFQRNALVTAWLALGKETAHNGCMRLIPRSHAMTLDKSRFDEASFLRTDLLENRKLIHETVRAELRPGDVLLFHSGLLHAAGRNQTDQRKLALVFTYRSGSNLALAGSHSASIPDVALSGLRIDDCNS